MQYVLMYYILFRVTKMAISKGQIRTAADELDATGQAPTLAAVRKALGGGSFTTTSEGMAERRARKASTALPLR